MILYEIRLRTDKNQRVLVTTLTKRMAEDNRLSVRRRRTRTVFAFGYYLGTHGNNRDLRLGGDVLVGINLLRRLRFTGSFFSGNLDADKEGFLRWRSLIQTIGRAARNVDGRVIMYADTVTDSMRQAIDRLIVGDRSSKYNQDHKITPKTVQRPSVM